MKYISQVFINIVMKNKVLSRSYYMTFPNTKYSLNDIIDEILYVLKTGISWINIRSPIRLNELTLISLRLAHFVRQYQYLY